MGSKYTTKIFNIYNTFERDIEKTRKFLFDFDYSLPQNNPTEFKEFFESNFINRYMFYEIGQETIAQFKHYLKTEVSIKLEFYSKLYDKYIDSVNADLENYRFNENSNFNKTDSFSNNSTVNSESDSTGDLTSFNLGSTIPATFNKIDDIKKGIYADTASSSNSNNSTNSNSNSNSSNSGKSNENSNNNVVKNGIMGVSPAEMFGIYKTNLSPFFEKLLNEFKDLFMLIF